MDTRSLRPADTIECNVRGLHFLAIFSRKEGRWLWIEPLSKSITYRRVRAHQILRKLDRQERLGVGT